MSAGMPPSGMDEYQRLLVQRAAQQRRNRLLVGAVVVLAVGVGAFRMIQDRKAKSLAQEKLEFGERFVDLDKNETGPFWNCITSSEVDVGMFQSTDQIQKRVESAYFTQQKTFSEHLTTECVPKIERARQAVSGLASTAPAEFKEAIDKYAASLPHLQSGIETYAEKIKGRGQTKDIDQLIQDTGNAFHSSQLPTAEGLAFEKFLYCAIPGIDKMNDAQAILEFLADTCYHKDAVGFMNGVREKCGPLISNVNKDAKVAASKTWKTTMKKFYEEDARQLRAWEDCARKSRKGKKVQDLEDFLVAAGEYVEARIGVVQAVKAAAAQAAGGSASASSAGK
ncbi:MAG TPA: hypothetical protein VH374_20185 [Polyangia bacterium]|nr:hypothetical protein [Polyangia bacterium]